MILKILKYFSYAVLALIVVVVIWWLFVDHRSELEVRADYCSYLFASDTMVAEANKVWGRQREARGDDYLQRSEWLVQQEDLLREEYEINNAIQNLAYSKGWDDVCYDPDLEFSTTIIDQPLEDSRSSFIELD